MITPRGRFLPRNAIRSASRTSAAAIRPDIDQPTILRDQRPITTVRYSQPSSVWMQVMSPTQA